MGNVVMVLLGLVIFALGAFLVFWAASGKFKMNKLPIHLRIRIGIIGAVLAAVGVVFIIFTFTE